MLFLMMIVLSSCVSLSEAFVPTISSATTHARKGTTTTGITTNKATTPGAGGGGLVAAASRTTRLENAARQTPDAEFEYQEMRAQVEAMDKQGVTARRLSPTKRFEIEAYVREVATTRPSPVPMREIGRTLPGTTWKLVFSTDNAILGDLPSGADVVLDFEEEGPKVDYTLSFSEKTLGLNRLVAKSTYSTDPSGVVTFVYDEITTDVFGLKNIGVGFFGLLKGRANYLQTRFIDGKVWIEGGSTPAGEDFFNVYLRKV